MVDLLKALLVITNYCINQNNCNQCQLKELCGKIIQEWY